TRLQVEGPNVCHRGGLGPDGRWPFLVATTGQAGKAFRAEQQAEGVDADLVPCRGEFAVDVINGEVAFAQGDGAVEDWNAGRPGPRLLLGRGEEAGAFAGVVPELMAQDAKGTWRVGEACGDFPGGKLLDKVSAEGFVLALAGPVGLEKEAGRLGVG